MGPIIRTSNHNKWAAFHHRTRSSDPRTRVAAMPWPQRSKAKVDRCNNSRIRHNPQEALHWRPRCLAHQIRTPLCRCKHSTVDISNINSSCKIHLTTHSLPTMPGCQCKVRLTCIPMWQTWAICLLHNLRNLVSRCQITISQLMSLANTLPRHSPCREILRRCQNSDQLRAWVNPRLLR